MSWTIRAVLIYSDVHRKPTLSLGSSGREIHPSHSSEPLPATGQQPKPNGFPTKIQMNHEAPSIQESLASWRCGGTASTAAPGGSASEGVPGGSPGTKTNPAPVCVSSQPLGKFARCCEGMKGTLSTLLAEQVSASLSTAGWGALPHVQILTRLPVHALYHLLQPQTRGSRPPRVIL